MTESLHKKVSITCASKVGKKVPLDWNCINRAQRGQAASALPRSCSAKCRSFEADCSDSDLTVTGANTDEQRETCTLRNMLSFTGVLGHARTSAKLSRRFRMAEVRGSSPLGSTPKICLFAGKTQEREEGRENNQPSLTPTCHQRN